MTQRKGEIIIPKVGFERARITTRRAPSPKIAAGIGGWIEWQLIDRHGRTVRGGEQHNLFLDGGLNRIASSPMIRASWVSHIAVGTGSAEPDVTDVALTAEVARSNTGLRDETTRTADGVYQFERTMEFDFGQANGNLTEWAAAGAASGNLIARELFRDGSGTPITITKTSDYKLRIAYVWRLTLAPVVPTDASFTVSGIGLINGTYRWIGSRASGGGTQRYGQRDLHAFAQVAAGSLGSGDTGAAFLSPSTGPAAYGSESSVGARQNIMATDSIFSAFTPGVWQRSLTGFFGTASANTGAAASLGVISGYATGTNGRGPGYIFVMDEADRFTKDNEHTLAINDLLTVTWGRS